MKIRLLYMSKAARDKKFKELSALRKKLRRCVIHSQYLHPQYVEDFKGEKVDTGYDNNQYRTYFKQLYSIEEE